MGPHIHQIHMENSFFPTSLTDAAKRHRVYIDFETLQAPQHLDAGAGDKEKRWEWSEITIGKRRDIKTESGCVSVCNQFPK